MPIVSPFWKREYVFRSSSANSSGSKTIPRFSKIIFTASLIKVRVFNPKKSIFSKPASSATELSNWVQTISESFAVATGTKLVMSSGVIITPQACIPVFRTVPSISIAFWRTSPFKSVPLKIPLNSLALLKASWLFFNSSDNRKSSIVKSFFNEISGISLANRSASGKDKLRTLAASRTADFAAMVPYVIIWATWLTPYFWIT